MGRKALLCVLTGAAACVDTSKHGAPDGGGAGPQPATCPASRPGGGADAAIPAGDTAAPGPYAWKNVVIKGGGFVTGTVMSPALRGLAFARTDVGGAYRFDPAGGRWMPITDWVGHSNSNLIGIESIAVDPTDPDRVYLAAGEYLNAGSGTILSSTDMGRTWTQNAIAAPMGGNADGRSMGERLAVDPNLPSTIYFGSRNAGLWISTDSAKTWNPVASFPTAGAMGYGLTFVAFDPSSGAPGSATPVLYVGVGVTTGNALYRSLDAGATWSAVTGLPAAAGAMMPHHAVFDGCGNLVLAFNDGPGPNNIKSGFVFRYGTSSGTWTDVSPPAGGGGFGGLAADPSQPGTLLVTTIDWWAPDQIYRTTDGGVTWSNLGLGKTGRLDTNGASWLTFGGGSVSATGWMGDVLIDPFDSAHALYITGQGLWSSSDVTAADRGALPSWTFADDGLEETVVLDLASPPAGAPLLSGVGDIGGFRHDDLSASPAGGMFTNPVFGNTSSIDFAEANPSVVARVGTGAIAVPGAYSTNGGTSWTPFAAPAVSGSAGSIAVSADGNTFVWAPQRNSSGTPTPSYSTDKGAHWKASAGLAAGASVAADRVDPLKFYASGRGAMLVSTDGGATFTSVATASAGRPRPVFGIEGDVWVATGSGLLHSQDSGASFPPLAGVSSATAVGFGAPVQPEQTYPSVYVAGAVGDVWGTYRSDDAGTSWTRIDDPQHQFGYINCLAGDRTKPGRVYLGTSGRGIVYGDPQATVSP